MSLKNLIQRSQQPTVTMSVTVPTETRGRLDSACSLLGVRRASALADAVHDYLAEMEAEVKRRATVEEAADV